MRFPYCRWPVAWPGTPLPGCSLTGAGFIARPLPWPAHAARDARRRWGNQFCLYRTRCDTRLRRSVCRPEVRRDQIDAVWVIAQEPERDIAGMAQQATTAQPARPVQRAMIVVVINDSLTTVKRIRAETAAAELRIPHRSPVLIDVRPMPVPARRPRGLVAPRRIPLLHHHHRISTPSCLQFTVGSPPLIGRPAHPVVQPAVTTRRAPAFLVQPAPASQRTGMLGAVSAPGVPSAGTPGRTFLLLRHAPILPGQRVSAWQFGRTVKGLGRSYAA
jgi:hypothetical protein